jgi:hypothetical protein
MLKLRKRDGITPAMDYFFCGESRLVRRSIQAPRGTRAHRLALQFQIANSQTSRGFQPPEKAQSAWPFGTDQCGKDKYNFNTRKRLRTSCLSAPIIDTVPNPAPRSPESNTSPLYFCISPRIHNKALCLRALAPFGIDSPSKLPQPLGDQHLGQPDEEPVRTTSASHR